MVPKRQGKSKKTQKDQKAEIFVFSFDWKKFLSPKWIGIILLVLVLAFLFLFGVYIYAKKPESNFVKKTTAIIPYPAALSFKEGIFVSYSQFLRELESNKKFYKEIQKLDLDAAENKEQKERVKSDILDYLIEQAVVSKLAKKYKVEVTDAEVEDQYKEVVAFYKDEENLKKQLETTRGLTIAEYKEKIKQRILEDKLKEKVMSEDPAFVDPRTKAEDILKRIQNGEDFAKLADEFSEYKEGGKGGDVGYIEKDKIETQGERIMFYLPAVKDVIFSLKEGEVASQVVKSDFGYHILKVTEKQPKKVRVSQILIRVPTFSDWLSSKIKEMKIIKLI